MWRGRVARIARRALVQLGLDPIEARHRIAQAPHEGGQSRRAAEARKHQVSRRIVTEGHGGRADRIDRHAARPGMLLGRGRIRDEIARGEDNAAIELLLASIDTRQHQSRGQELEGAAHREKLVAAIGGAPTARGVEHGDAEAAALLLLELPKQRYRILGEGRQG